MKNKFNELHKQFEKNREIFSRLSKLVKELKNKAFFAVFGGLAIDAYYGGQTRFQGILGMDFMNHYTIHIDNEKNRISLKSRKPYGPS